jgi:hypothetical protein
MLRLSRNEIRLSHEYDYLIVNLDRSISHIHLRDRMLTLAYLYGHLLCSW